MGLMKTLLPFIELVTRWGKANCFSVNWFSKRSVPYRRKRCRVILFITSCSRICGFWGCVLFYLGVALYLFNLRNLPTKPLSVIDGGRPISTVTLLIWTHPFGHYKKLPHCKARHGFNVCKLTDDIRAYSRADAVIFHHRDISTNVSALPVGSRPHGQKWIWMNFESPSHTRNLRKFEGLFNLTMSYRTDSDIYLPYGYLLPRHHGTFGLTLRVPSLRRPRPRLLAWVISNWSESQARVIFYRQLSRYVHVDVFGRAGLPLPVDGGNSLVRTVKRYLFYLALENSQHTDYITEKVWNALLAGAVPIVLGPTRENYERFLPSEAFIHVDDFPTVRTLVKYLMLLRRSPAHLEHHLAWRRTYKVHMPVFWAEHYCAACHAVEKAMGRTDTVMDLAEWFRS